MSEPLWIWLTAGENVCPGCSARHNETLTLAEWEASGLPGDGMTYCGTFCRCLLFRTDLVERLAFIETGERLVGSAAAEALGMRTPVVTISAPEQARIMDLGLDELLDLDYNDAREALQEKILGIQYVENLRVRSLHELIDIYRNMTYPVG